MMSKAAEYIVSDSDHASSLRAPEADIPVVAKPKAAYLLGEESFELIYPPHVREGLEALADFSLTPIYSHEFESRKHELAEVEILFAGWNMVKLDESFIGAVPKLKVIFYGAGSIRYCLTPAFWEREIQITSAYAANSIPVAEYTLGTILLSLKNFWHYTCLAKNGQGWGDHTRPVRGNYMSRVGLVSCGMIARRTIKHLREFDLKVGVYCPFLSDYEAKNLGVDRMSLEDIFSESDVVSLHAPDIPETKGMIGREHFNAMRIGATFINSARGAIVRHTELLEVAQARPDLSFVLDVTDPEPPEKKSRLLQLPNIIVSPHIAGSMGPEIGRLGEYMLEELKRYLHGKPLRWGIKKEHVDKMA